MALFSLMTAFGGLLLCLLVLVVSFIVTPSLPIKTMILNTTGAIITMLIIILAEIVHTPSLLDIALIYISTSFISTMMMLKFITSGESSSDTQ